MTSHTVTLRPTGHTFEVPEGRPILACALETRVSLPYACRMGMCRTCRGRVVEGRVDHGIALERELPLAERAEGWALLCVAKPLSDLVVEAHELPALEPPREYECVVKRIRKATPDIAIIDLRLPLHVPMRFSSGQYIDVFLADGRRRSYSIANASAVTGLIDVQLHIKRVPGGAFTDFAFEGLKERQKLRFEGPLGTFFLRPDRNGPVVFLAAGTGYAPVRSIIARALEDGCMRPMKLYWGARTKAELYALDEPRAWAERYPSFEFVPVLSAPAAEDDWQGRRGYVHAAALDDVPDLSTYEVYAAGSPRMVDAARKDLVERAALPADQFYADAFVDASYSQSPSEEGHHADH